jgi:hypothetical protein
MKYIKYFESKIEELAFKVGDYVILDLAKINLADGINLTNKYCIINYAKKSETSDYWYDVEPIDKSYEEMSVIENEILRVMTPEEIILNKYNI